MKLKMSYQSVADIPAGYEDLYSEQDGAWVLTGIEGMKSDADITRLQSSLQKERTAHKETRQKLQRFGSLDADDVIEKLDRIEELEAAAAAGGGGADDSKVNALVEARLRTKVAPLERELNQLRETKTTLEADLQTYQASARKRTLHDHLRDAATKAKVRDTALSDVLMIGEHMFELDEDGKPVTKDGVGVTPGIDPTVWLSEARNTRPHWWPESQGAGASGGKGGAGGSNPFSKDGWNMTEQGQLMRTNPARAEQMAKAAGTTVGGPRPK